jgi:hypothetical protein
MTKLMAVRHKTQKNTHNTKNFLHNYPMILSNDDDTYVLVLVSMDEKKIV